jgi:hypothetical protein
MEVAWVDQDKIMYGREVKYADRGKIPHDAYHQPYGPEREFEFEKLDLEMKHWWNRVFDACRNAEKIGIAGTDGQGSKCYFRIKNTGGNENG